MKKFLLILSSGTILFFSSCASKSEAGGMSEQAKKNLESHRGVSKCFETGDFSKVGDYMAADVVDYAGEMGPVKGLDSVKASLIQMASSMTDTKHETIKELADDEYVMAWMRFSGTCTMDMMGMKKGDKISTEAIELSQYNKDGKVIAHWTFMEPRVFMKMMGGGQTPPPADATVPPKDSLSK